MPKQRNEESITVLAPIVITIDNGHPMTNDRYGRLIDSFASEYANVIVPASFADKTNKTFYPGGKSLYAYEIAHSNVDIRSIKFSTGSMSPVRKLIVWLKRINPIARAIRQSDLIYIVMPGSTPSVAVLISRILRRPYILYFGSDWETLAPFMARWGGGGVLLRFYQYLSHQAEKYAVKGSLFTLVTGRMLRERLEHYSDHVLETVPMIPLRRSDFYEREDTCKASPIHLLQIGALIPSKGARDLIEALSIIRAEGIDADCTLIGGGEPAYIDTLLGLAKELRVEEHVHISGYITDYEDILRAYREADIFVLPTHSEGFPRVIYEAMSQSLPVVTTSIPSISAVLEHGEDAFLVSPAQARELASAIVEIVGDFALRKRLIKRGSSFAGERVGEGTTGDQVLRILDELTSKPQGEQDLRSWSHRYYSQSKPYHERMASKWSESWQGVFEKYRSVVKSQVPGRGRILDLGCGGGQSSYLLGEVFESVVGLDFSLALLRGFPLEKKRPNLRFINADASALPLEQETFAAVASYATLEHLFDIEATLDELDRILDPGGALILMGPNMLSPFHSLKLLLRGLTSEKKHPDGSLRVFFRRLWTLTRKSMTTGYKFEYRQPYIKDLEFPGSDFDAICLVNPIDLKRWAESKGYSVSSLSEGTSLGGRIISRVLPSFAGGMCFIAQKGRP